ncbi:MAG: carboxymuconolactone decarboxylase family protein [Acidobacteriota bacterium]
MAWIRIIDEGDARGALKRQYDAAVRRAGKVYNVVKISSLKPEMVRASMSFYRTLMHSKGGLSRAQKEMIAVVVSRANNCFY